MQTLLTFIHAIAVVINRLLHGGTYKVRHTDQETGQSKVFWCDTWQDAVEWVSCALNTDRVTVTDKHGFVLAVRA